MLDVVSRFDGLSSKMASFAELFVYSMDGFFEKTARETPNYLGLSKIRGFAQNVIGEILVTAAKLPREFGFDFPDQTAYEFFLESLKRQLEEVKLLYVKRFRDILIARAWQTNTGVQDARILTRNARSISITSWVLLSSRKAIIDTYNDNQIKNKVDLGITKFKLDGSDDLLDTIFDVADYPILKDSLFHPRSTVVVGGENVYSE